MTKSPTTGQEPRGESDATHLLECADLDEAISYAAKIPAAKSGSIEVRPIMVFE